MGSGILNWKVNEQFIHHNGNCLVFGGLNLHRKEYIIQCNNSKNTLSLPVTNVGYPQERLKVSNSSLMYVRVWPMKLNE